MSCLNYPDHVLFYIYCLWPVGATHLNFFLPPPCPAKDSIFEILNMIKLPKRKTQMAQLEQPHLVGTSDNQLDMIWLRVAGNIILTFSFYEWLRFMYGKSMILNCLFRMGKCSFWFIVESYVPTERFCLKNLPNRMCLVDISVRSNWNMGWSAFAICNLQTFWIIFFFFFFWNMG